jgi:hypothetical protein
MVSLIPDMPEKNCFHLIELIQKLKRDEFDFDLERMKYPLEDFARKDNNGECWYCGRKGQIIIYHDIMCIRCYWERT